MRGKLNIRSDLVTLVDNKACAFSRSINYRGYGPQQNQEAPVNCALLDLGGLSMTEEKGEGSPQKKGLGVWNFKLFAMHLYGLIRRASGSPDTSHIPTVCYFQCSEIFLDSRF